MQKEIIIGENTYILDNSIYVLKVYKDIFKRPWHSDKNKSDAKNLSALKLTIEWNKIIADLNKKYRINEQLQALELSQDKRNKYFNELDNLFNNLSIDEQNRLKQQMIESEVDYEFILDTIYAMVVSGGYKGSQEQFLKEIPPKELNANSEIMKTASQFIEDFLPDIKKNKIV